MEREKQQYARAKREREVNGKSYKGRRMTIKQTNGGKKEKERSFEER